MESKEFKSNYSFDFNTYKEFNKAYMKKNIKIYCYFIFMWIIYVIIGYEYKSIIGIIFSAATFTLFVMLILALKYKISTKRRYKQMVSINKNNPTNDVVIIDKKGIHAINEDTGNKQEIDFEQIIGIIETKNLIILKMKYNVGVIVDKTTLIGGSKEELIQYLFEKCSNIKRKKVEKSGANISNIIFIVAMLIILIISAIGMIMSIESNKYMSKLNATLQNNQYNITDIKSLYDSSIKLDTAIKVTKNHEKVNAYIYKFGKQGMSEYSFEYWASKEIEDNEIVKDKIEYYTIEDGIEKYDIETQKEYVVLIKKNEYVFYGIVENEYKEQLITLLEIINYLK